MLIGSDFRLRKVNSISVSVAPEVESVESFSAALMKNLQVLQNKAVELILDRPFYSSATETLSQLGWISLEQRRLFHCVNEITSHSIELLRSSDVHSYS